VIGRRHNLTAVLLLASGLHAGGVMAMEEERAQELVHMLRHDCGSCHGMNLTGGLGPDLTRLAEVGQSVASVFATIREGRAGTAMPPFRGVLNDEEIQWLSRYLLTRNRADNNDRGARLVR